LQRLVAAAEAHSPRLTVLGYALYCAGSRISEILGTGIRDCRPDHGRTVATRGLPWKGHPR
jgi:hypothetical protein